MASTSQATNTGGTSQKWEYPSFLLAEIDGGFVHPTNAPEDMCEYGVGVVCDNVAVR